MISPTGKGIRNDSEGSGEYGASRGSKLHNGIDYLCDEGQEIIAPFNMTILRKAYTNKDMQMTGIEWSKGKTTGKMFYFEPDMSLIGRFVQIGTVIGKAQSVSNYYGLPAMKNHIHFQIDK